MATVPLRAETEGSWRRPERPHLVLVTEMEPSPARPRARQRVRVRWEDRLLAVAAVAVLLFCLLGAGNWLYRAAATSYRSPLAVTASVPVTVRPGDSLWTYAQKYGAPDAYILDRVDAIARANHLASDTPLVPGQRLTVPVPNPVILARLDRSRLLAQR